MTATRSHPDSLTALADAVLLPCFDGLKAPEWVRRRVGESMGGVCLFARNVASVEQVAALSASLAAERESVIIAIDEEAGDVTRLDAATGSRFPGAAALGRVDDPDATVAVAQQVGALLAAAGVSVNLAPCADVAVDPDNPVIGVRSFGADADLVARHVDAWTRGQQSQGVAACVKHFPGHGDTKADSHRTTAVVSGDLAELRRTALPPFAAAIAAGTAAVMPGHLLVPAVDDEPASMSRRWTTGVLRGELGFTGAIVTDALEMAGVADRYGIAGGAVRALAVGADVLCIGGRTRPEEEITAIRDAIVAAVHSGELTEDRLADAAARARTVGLAAARAVADASVPDPSPTDISTSISSRALEVAGPMPPLREPLLVLQCEDEPNIAVGAIPWGPGIGMTPAPVTHRVSEPAVLGDSLVDELRQAGSVLVVTRDRHRHPWMNHLTATVRSVRGDAILIEMGVSGVRDADAPAVASYGATAANARAVMTYLHR